MSVLKLRAWVVFHRGPRCKKWVPTSAHASVAAAKKAYWEQINNGPEGSHCYYKMSAAAATEQAG